MKHNDRAQLLRRALRGNAIFSTVTGLTLLVGGGALDPVLGVPGWVLRLVGFVLLPFAVGLWVNASKEEVHRGEAWVAVALDLGWVAGSAALVTLGLWPLTTVGTWTVIGVADIVLVCALAQALGLVKAQRSLAATAQ